MTNMTVRPFKSFHECLDREASLPSLYTAPGVRAGDGVVVIRTATPNAAAARSQARLLETYVTDHGLSVGFLVAGTESGSRGVFESSVLCSALDAVDDGGFAWVAFSHLDRVSRRRETATDFVRELGAMNAELRIASGPAIPTATLAPTRGAWGRA